MKNFFKKKFLYLAILAILFLSFYIIIRYTTFAVSDYNTWDRLFGIILLLSETHLALHAAGYILGIIRLKNHKLVHPTLKITNSNQPTVAVIVAAKNEPDEILAKTLSTFSAIDYHNMNIYLLDGSNKKIYKTEAISLKKFFKVNIFRQNKPHGAKAGMINDFLQQMNEKYIAVFDADQNPTPQFLKETIGILEKNKHIAFVQTPQFYSNLSVSPIALGAEMQQAIFFENMCEAKQIAKAMFCCGTNVIFRRDALLDVGGFSESSITEDFATSLKLHLKGYESHYYNHVLAFGMAPENLPAYFKQQNRWAAGTIGVFREIIKNFFINFSKLKPIQWWEYFLSGTHYFIGWAFFFLMICPIIYLIFGIPSYFMNPYVYLLLYVPYFIFSLTIFFTTMFKRKYHLAQVYYGIILSNLSFPILMKAAIYGLLNKQIPFEITTKGKSQTMSYFSLWPWVIMIFFNILAIMFGIQTLITAINNYNTAIVYAISINIFWCLYHTFMLLFIYYFNANPNFTQNKIADYKEIQ